MQPRGAHCDYQPCFQSSVRSLHLIIPCTRLKSARHLCLCTPRPLGSYSNTNPAPPHAKTRSVLQNLPRLRATLIALQPATSHPHFLTPAPHSPAQRPHTPPPPPNPRKTPTITNPSIHNPARSPRAPASPNPKRTLKKRILVLLAIT